MPLAGRQLSYKWALALGYYAGWSGSNLVTAVSVMCAESVRYVEAWHYNLDDDGNITSTDRGLFQINDKAHLDLSDADAYKAIPNALYAKDLSKPGWGAWAAYNSEAYLKFVPIVFAVKLLGEWKSRVANVETELG